MRCGSVLQSFVKQKIKIELFIRAKSKIVLGAVFIFAGENN